MGTYYETYAIIANDSDDFKKKWEGSRSQAIDFLMEDEDFPEELEEFLDEHPDDQGKAVEIMHASWVNPIYDDMLGIEIDISDIPKEATKIRVYRY